MSTRTRWQMGLAEAVAAWPGPKHSQNPSLWIQFPCPVCSSRDPEVRYWVERDGLACACGCDPSEVAEVLLAGRAYTDESAQHAAGSSWRPADLGPILAGTHKRAEPTLGLTRTDGLRMIYPGKEHTVIGEMESGKSWFAAACCAAEIEAGRHVLYIHFEESDPSDTVGRLQALGVEDEEIMEFFHFVGPEEPVRPALLADLLDPAPSLVVLDGVNEGMALHGHEIRQEDGAAAFRRLLVKPFTAAGAATLAADHVVKDREARGRTPLGSVHKGNAVNGALFLLENAEPFGRGLRGRSHVFVTKDRPGHLRKHGRASRTPGKTFMGELVVDDTRAQVPFLNLAFWEPAPADKPKEGDKPTKYMVRVSRLLAEHPDGLSKNAIETMTTGKAPIIRTALELLVSEGYVAQERRGQAVVNTLIKPYEDEDEGERG